MIKCEGVKDKNGFKENVQERTEDMGVNRWNKQLGLVLCVIRKGNFEINDLKFQKSIKTIQIQTTGLMVV